MVILLIPHWIGCDRCYALDGNWKIKFPHCMMPVKGDNMHLSGSLRFVDVCPNQPSGKLAFCEEHLPVAVSNSYPTTVQEFVKFCETRGCVHYIFIIAQLPSDDNE